MLTLLFEIKQFRIIYETLANLTGPILNMMLILFVIFYIYSLFGMYLFGGMVGD